ncbi:MAG: septum formation initiator family protein [Candidatus Spechtbacterales bacterium]|nr:septum formation initiator family protein [Candidatus Spechtbacterales bacterium]
MREFFNKFVLPFVLLAFVIVLGSGVIQQVRRNIALSSELGELKADVAALEEENMRIREEVDSFSDPSTIDKEARERLNLKKEGEKVVVILPSEKDDPQESVAVEEKNEQKNIWDKLKAWLGF